jgi:hypothetical protein
LKMPTASHQHVTADHRSHRPGSIWVDHRCRRRCSGEPSSRDVLVGERNVDWDAAQARIARKPPNLNQAVARQRRAPSRQSARPEDPRAGDRGNPVRESEGAGVHRNDDDMASSKFPVSASSVANLLLRRDWTP